jgi:hypothetical protein
MFQTHTIIKRPRDKRPAEIFAERISDLGASEEGGDDARPAWIGGLIL